MDLPLDAPLKPNKGLEGGACNRQSCQAEPALHYNHGSYAWYCGTCAVDIGLDHVNLRHWNARWLPECGHAQFETRAEMDARKSDWRCVGCKLVVSSDKEPHHCLECHCRAFAKCDPGKSE